MRRGGIINENIGWVVRNGSTLGELSLTGEKIDDFNSEFEAIVY